MGRNGGVVYGGGGRGPEIKWAGILDFARGEDLCYPSLDIDVMSEWLRLRLTGPASGSGSGQAAVILVQGPLSALLPLSSPRLASAPWLQYLFGRNMLHFFFPLIQRHLKLCRINGLDFYHFYIANYCMVSKMLWLDWFEMLKIDMSKGFSFREFI